MNVCLDPGHGKRNTGCVHGSLIEKNWNWVFVRRLQARLTDAGHTVVLTRGKDENPGFWRRAWRARKCDLTISVHVNANRNPTFRGLEVYHLPDSKRAVAFAQEMARFCPLELRRNGDIRVYSVHDDPATDKDNWLQRPKRVIRWYRQPSALVEYGYASNSQDRKFLLSDEGNSVCVEATARAIESWYYDKINQSAISSLGL